MILNLDYDDWTEDSLWHELSRLKEKYNFVYQIWETSPQSFHIRSKCHIEDYIAWEIMDFSRCSSAYKLMCHKYGYMPFRISSKLAFYKGISRLVPKPKLLCEI